VTFSGRFACDETMSDPRVTGRNEMKMTLVQAAEPKMDYFVCEDATLTTEDGTWRGECYGSEFWSEDGTVYTTGHATLVGDGAYDGLVYHQLFTQPGEGDDYLYVGFIEPVG
jgi:hypothetical protein